MSNQDTYDQPSARAHWTGQWVIVRCIGAGVHFGRLEDHQGNMVILNDARRIWQWKSDEGPTLYTLNEVANHGPSPKGSNMSESIEWVQLLSAVEILPVSAAALERFKRTGWSG